MRDGVGEKTLDDEALALRLRRAVETLPTAERREILAVVAAKGR